MDPQHTLEDYSVRLATLSPGFSGADIANLCNEAAIMVIFVFQTSNSHPSYNKSYIINILKAARKNKEFIEAIDFELASERIIAGLERKKLVTGHEKKLVAIHEAGHAVSSWFLPGG